MARRKKKAAKKTASVETPPADEPEPVEDDVEPEISDPFGSHEAEAAKEEAAADEDKAEEKAPAGPPDRATVTFAEKKAQERGEKPSDGDPQKWGIVDFIQNSAYTSEDIEAVDYYEMAGVSVLTMADGRKFDVTD